MKTILILIAALYVYFLIRNFRVFKFREQLNEMCYKYNRTEISIHGKVLTNAWEWYDNAATYPKMLFSFKPLKFRYWLPNDVIQRLTSNEN